MTNDDNRHQAGEDAEDTQVTEQGLEIPIPSKGHFMGSLKHIAKSDAGRSEDEAEEDR